MKLLLLVSLLTLLTLVAPIKLRSNTPSLKLARHTASARHTAQAVT